MCVCVCGEGGAKNNNKTMCAHMQNRTKQNDLLVTIPGN